MFSAYGLKGFGIRRFGFAENLCFLCTQNVSFFSVPVLSVLGIIFGPLTKVGCRAWALQVTTGFYTGSSMRVSAFMVRG